MKTILYQPLFINPQAYFVFPQLYHIEKGDSYIEPANITGQLIINDLTKVLTSTPTLNVVQDTKFSVVSTDGNLQSTQVYSVNINNGSVIDVPIVSEEIFNNKEETNIYYDFGTNKDIEIDVELIADYPNQLCYDGKSYAVAYGLPILTDYTIIADRTWFAEKVDNGVFMSKALEQNGAFILEYKQGDKWNTYSYYSATNINIDKDNSIVYQTKNKYNEQTIYPGDKQDTDTLFIGTIRKDDSRSFIGCHGDILLFNRTLTEYEISWVKNNMMCSKQQEPDIDL